MQKKCVESPRKTKHNYIRSENRDNKNTESGNINIIYAYGTNCLKAEILVKNKEISPLRNYCAYISDSNQQEIRKYDKRS